MEASDPQTLAFAAAIGGAVMFAVMKYLAPFLTPEAGSTGESVKPKPTVGLDTLNKSKTSKKKNASKKKTSKPKSVRIEETVQTKEEKKAPQAIPEVKEKKKKKRKKKKKKAAAEPAVVEGTQPVVQTVPTPVVTTSQPVDDGEGWQTVPVKHKPNDFGMKMPVSSGSGSDKSKNRDTRVIVSIGDHWKVVLGEGGSTITNIQNVSGAKINLNREAKNCTLVGDEESIAVAKQLINSLVSNQAKYTFEVTKRLDKAILAKADTKQNIRDLSGARIEYAYGETREDPLTVVITGEAEKVELAKGLVTSYLNGKTPEGDDGVKRIKVTGFQGRILIGQKGSQINELQKESGASINVEFTEDNKLAIVSIIGSTEQINRGLEFIQTFLVQHNVKARVDLDPDARGILSKLNDLRKEIPNLQVEVSADRTEIHLCGSASGIRKGNDLLLDWISKELGPPELKRNEVMEMIELGDAAGKVIGKGRSVLLNILKNAPGSKIEIKKGTLCYVYGKEEGVKKAFKDIKDIVTKHKDVIAKVRLEQKELENANWVVLPNESSGMLSDVNDVNLSQNDWGGFNLAQSQGW